MAAPDPFAIGGDPKLVEVGPSIGPSNLLAAAKADEPAKDDERAGDPLLAWVRREVSGADSHVKEFREDATTCYRFYAGHQLDPIDASILKTDGRPSNAFNTVQKFIRYLCGVERRSPEALIFRAEEEYDVEAAQDSEAATRGYEWATRRTDASLERSRAFEASLICGIGGVDWFLDTVSERLPFPKPQWISSFELLWPECSLINLANTRWRAREIEMDPRDIVKKWPDADAQVDSLRDGDVFRGRPDPAKVEYTVPWIATKDYGGASGEARKKNKLKVLEFQWWDDESGFEFSDPLSGRREWLARDAFRRYASRMSNLVAVGAAQPIQGEEERDKRIYRKLFLLERRFQLGVVGRCVGNRFSINTLTGMWDEDKRKWFGFMRVLMDPQRYLNKFWNQMLEINAHQAKGGLEAEEDALKPNQIADLKRDYTKPGSVTIFAEGALSQNKVRQKTLPQVSQGTTEIMKFTLEAHTLVSGLSPSAQSLDQGPGVSGPVAKRRQSAGLTLFAEEFDTFSKFRKEEGRIVFAFLGLIADGRTLSPPSPYDPLVFKLDRRVFDREYDLYLDDTEGDPSIREQYSEWIIQLAPTLMRLNKFIPEMWDYFKLPIRIREKLKQGMLRQQQEAMQMQAAGLSPGGRGQARDPKEQQAKIAKLTAEAGLADAKAEHQRASRPARDLKTIISALHEAQKAKIEASQHKREGRHDIVELAGGISELFHQGADREAERAALTAKAQKYEKQPKDQYAGGTAPE